MKKQALFLLLHLLFLGCSELFSQDVFRVYFEYGKSKPKNGELNKLNSWLDAYSGADIDSISVIGFADSIGKYKNNIRLSEKRASHVKSFVTKQFNDLTQIRHYGKGEKNKKIEETDRRVEVRIWISKEVLEMVRDTATGHDSTNKMCLLKDHELLGACYISNVIHKRRKFIKLYISQEDYLPKKKKKFYYLTGDSTRIVLNRVKFVPKTSGKFWFEKERYEALVPEESYNRNKIVYIKDGECDSCFSDSLVGLYLGDNQCMAVDLILTRNMQFKPGFLRLKTVKVRVPSMFVDSFTSYFEHSRVISWKVKKRHPEYKYEKLGFSLSGLGIIVNPISKVVPCCGPRSFRGFINCASIRHLGNLGLESGIYRRNGKNSPYAGLMYFRESTKAFSRLLIGMDHEFSAVINMKYQGYFVTVPAFLLSPFNTWKNLPYDKRIRYFKAYLGSELRSGKFRNEMMDIDQTLYTGFKYWFLGSNALFVQYGVGYQYKGLSKGDFFTLMQAGLEIKLVGLHQ